MGVHRTARDRMVSSAAILFRERGVEATSLADVIEHAQAPRGSIYHHFPEGKPQLVAEATHLAGGLIGAVISNGLADAGPAATVESMVGLFRRQLIDTDYAAGCPVAAGALGGVPYPAGRIAAGEAFTSWEATISASLWQRGVSMPRAQSLATMIIAAVEGALVLSIAQRSTQALDRIAGELVALTNATISDATRTTR
ncbi:MAG: putative HTH-type transcriptional regulator [Nocardia sp.]|uniref:TetR/AcrR family transcriptional regulator n=1 Tax=Nocardia sp. TaxID=1821 RepID=UPI0026273E0B|nr:TetR/AcrR family transcriptional regulator [Nocardia sp.]MCU1647729.1 putative HTH-type transcriptional regulator [Nocardia sp.]